MKAELKIVMIAVTMGFAISAFAEPSLQKKQSHINFSELIQESGAQAKQLTETMNKKLHVRETAQVEKEKKTVADFVDVEVDVKPAPKLTDRRFDSVGPIRVAHEFSVALMPKGGS